VSIILNILLKIIERSSILNEKAKLESLTNNHAISLENQIQKNDICLPINNIEVHKGNLDAPSNDSGKVQDEDREDDKEEVKSLQSSKEAPDISFYENPNLIQENEKHWTIFQKIKSQDFLTCCQKFKIVMKLSRKNKTSETKYMSNQRL